MSEVVLCAMERDTAYKQTGIDDLESLVWVLVWFFVHTEPRGYEKGWDYLQDAASYSSVNEWVWNTSKCSSSRPEHTRGSIVGSKGLGNVELGSRPELKHASPSSSTPRSNKRRRTMPAGFIDTLQLWLSPSYGARSSKVAIKTAGILPKDFRGWDSSTITWLFTRIWKLRQWDDLRPDLEGLRLDPSPSRDWDDGRKKESFATLVKELKTIYNDVADHAKDFYGGSS